MFYRHICQKQVPFSMNLLPISDICQFSITASYPGQLISTPKTTHSPPKKTPHIQQKQIFKWHSNSNQKKRWNASLKSINKNTLKKYTHTVFYHHWPSMVRGWPGPPPSPDSPMDRSEASAWRFDIIDEKIPILEMAVNGHDTHIYINQSPEI